MADRRRRERFEHADGISIDGLFCWPRIIDTDMYNEFYLRRYQARAIDEISSVQFGVCLLYVWARTVCVHVL